MALMEIDLEKNGIFQKKLSFHQSGLEWRAKLELERSRTAAMRSTTYEAAQNAVFEENDVKNFE